MFKNAMVALALLALWESSDLLRAESLAALDESEIPSVTAISAFHSLHDKSNQLFLRLIEADGSADVAKNPVALFLVITNDASGPDLQEQVWSLPSVAEVRKVALRKSGLQISARVDGALNEQTGRLAEHSETLSVSYSFAKNKLNDHLEVRTSRP